MSNKPLVSIYIPTHNRCSLLKRAVESVVNQTYSNIELIIVNDASSDETKAYLEQLSTSCDIPIQVFHQTTAKGACAARNIAIANAQGKYITGLDDDDEFLPHRIERLVTEFDPNFSLVCTGFRWQHGNKYTKVDSTSKTITLNTELDYNYCSNQVLTLTERFKSVGGFDESLVACQDYDMWTRLIEQFGSAKRISGDSYIIHRGDDVTRITDCSNWLKGHDQYMAKHGNKMSSKNKINQEFRRLITKREQLTLKQLIMTVHAGLAIKKLRYFLSTNFSLLARAYQRLFKA